MSPVRVFTARSTGIGIATGVLVAIALEQLLCAPWGLAIRSQSLHSRSRCSGSEYLDGRHRSSSGKGVVPRPGEVGAESRPLGVSSLGGLTRAALNGSREQPSVEKCCNSRAPPCLPAPFRCAATRLPDCRSAHLLLRGPYPRRLRKTRRAFATQLGQAGSGRCREASSRLPRETVGGLQRAPKGGLERAAPGRGPDRHGSRPGARWQRAMSSVSRRRFRWLRLE